MEAAKADGSRRYLLDEQQVEMYKDRFVSIGMSCILVCVCVRARARERERERERGRIFRMRKKVIVVVRSHGACGCILREKSMSLHSIEMVPRMPISRFWCHMLTPSRLIPAPPENSLNFFLFFVASLGLEACVRQNLI